MITRTKTAHRFRIKQRIRKKILGTAERPRLTVYRSLRHIYAQIVDDAAGKTIASASSNSKELRERLKQAKSKKEISKLVGMNAAEQAIAKKIQTVVFDRNGYRYHGNVKALADGAREAGLKF